MIKKLFLLFVVLPISVGCYAQVGSSCGTLKYLEYQETKHQGYKEAVKLSFNIAKEYSESSNAKSIGTHTIPVVVHVVYNTPEQNLHDTVIFNQIELLSDYFNRRNADTILMRSEFDIVKGKANIEFELAQYDSNNLPTNGITRTFTSLSTFMPLWFDMAEVEYVKSTADGGHDPWDTLRYLNIWVCNMLSDNQLIGFNGYATPPANLPNWQGQLIPPMTAGVVIHFPFFGSNNPNDPTDIVTGKIHDQGKLLVHEVGHYLGLRHIDGDGDCSQDDWIDDTPIGSDLGVDCDTMNPCFDNIQGVDLPEMYENYMGFTYESCQNTLTQGQCDFMNAVLETARYDLVHNNQGLNIPEAVLNSAVIYPNPSSGDVTISSSIKLKLVVLRSLSGVEIARFSCKGYENALHFDKVPPGTYFLSLIDEMGQTSVQKIIFI
ncbi:MAG: T9SS type A sorting domain-containing protein [Crocinitomicaceae bacterium]|nr:T9SS type A sorting domain-containing protein [Crocinitomicaceae bacterium]